MCLCELCIISQTVTFLKKKHGKQRKSFLVLFTTSSEIRLQENEYKGNLVSFLIRELGMEENIDT